MFGLLEKEVSLCSEINGELFFHGEPLKNIKIVRSLNYIGEHEYTDDVLSDSEGRFHFNAYKIKSRAANRLFKESRVFQYIYLEHEGEKKYIWRARQSGADAIPELSEKLQAMYCELSDPEVRFNVNIKIISDTTFYAKYEAVSRCRWVDNFEISETFND